MSTRSRLRPFIASADLADEASIESAKARLEVCKELAPLLGRNAAIDAANALGGAPSDMIYNGYALARAIAAAVDRAVRVERSEAAAERLRTKGDGYMREWRSLSTYPGTPEMEGRARGLAFSFYEIAAEHEADANAARRAP